MNRHYHIITCDTEEIMEKYINDGFVGIRPVLTKSEKISTTVRMNWDILADIARIKSGDYIFLHSQGLIQGVFEVVEQPFIDQNLVPFFNGPKINTENWSNNWDAVKQQIESMEPVWYIQIKPHNRWYFKKMSMDYVFDRISRGVITSLPQRLRYEDKNKTTKGLIKEDFEVILRLFYNYSSIEDNNTHSNGQSNLVPITFDYLCTDGYEKNLEALIVDRVRSGTFEITIRSENFNTSKVQLPHSNVLNTVPLGYLKMADLLTWDEKNGKVINPWIWELKTEKNLNWDKLREEIKKLSERASYLNNFFKTSQEDFKITGVIVAPSFKNDAIDRFMHLITPIGVVEEILLIGYKGTGENAEFTLVGVV